MNILILSEDTSIFNPQSKAFVDLRRMSENTEAIHVIVCTTKKDPFVKTKVSEKLFLYPTSSSRFSTRKAIFDIIKSEIIWKSQCIAHLIIAQDSLRLAHIASTLSQTYKRNYMITLYKNSILTYGTRNPFMRRLHSKTLDRVYKEASAIQVETQLQGEIISSRNSSLEKKIFILPLVDAGVTLQQKTTEESMRIDLRKKFPQFNILVLAQVTVLSRTYQKKAKQVMVELHNRYPKMGLVIVTEKKPVSFFSPALPPHIVILEDTATHHSYAESSTVFIDLEEETHEISSLIKAIHAGCVPIVAPTKENQSIVRDGENGFIVDVKKPNLFARKIMEVLEVPGLRMKMRMYRYDITDLYGKNPEDYYTRLISIWKASLTPESTMHTEVTPGPAYFPPITPSSTRESIPATQTITEVVSTTPAVSVSEYYPAFTLATVKKAFKRFEKSKRSSTPHTQINAFENEIFDVDAVEIGIKQALKDIIVNPDLVEDEKDRSWGDEIEILRGGTAKRF